MTGFIRTIFSEVSTTYETVNHIMTFGLDRVWRRRTAKIAARGGGSTWIDLCTGTGETAIYLSHYAPDDTTIFAVDFSLPMITEAAGKTKAETINFVVSDVGALPFPDNSLDLITMSFATRNINTSRNDLIDRFSEFYRILKPGGRFVTLETSQPPVPFIRWWFHLYVKLAVEAIGSRISGSRTAYAYLAKSMLRFYDAKELAGLLRRAGFENIGIKRYLFGAVAVHRGIKRDISG